MQAISNENCNASWLDRCDFDVCIIFADVPFVFPLHAWITSSVDVIDRKENYMLRKTSQRALTNLIVRSSAIALIAAVMPLGMNTSGDGVSFDAPSAHAAGQGGGGGHGGGHGGGQGGGQGGGGGQGVGAAEAHGEAHGPSGHGATASGLGRGNAGHAADPAKDNAAPHSAVGTAVAYGEAREANGAGGALDELEAAVKDATIEIGDALARLLGID